jgi:hypothetical protein
MNLKDPTVRIGEPFCRFRTDLILILGLFQEHERCHDELHPLWGRDDDLRKTPAFRDAIGLPPRPCSDDIQRHARI